MDLFGRKDFKKKELSREVVPACKWRKKIF
jgi:hypothetical protein